MARVLVTGASGFIAHHLLHALAARRHKVTALVRPTSNVERLEPSKTTLLRADITDLPSLSAAVAGHSVVYHLAGRLKALRSSQFYRVNELGVLNICRACVALPDPPVLVLVSSLAAVGPSPRGRLRVESDPPTPVSDYGLSKRAGELAAQQFAHRLPITIVRPPIVFGELDRTTLQIFQSVAKSRIHLVPGYAPHKFSMIHSADLAELLIRAAEWGERLPPVRTQTDTHGKGCYFAAGPEHPTYYRLGLMIGKALGYRWVLPIPFIKPAVWMVAGVSDLIGRMRGRPPRLCIDKVREATAGDWACSPEKAARQLGFSVTVPLATRLKQTVDWYREHGWV
ncbi:MAG: NAD-dependent epimerase/dehydratase family protein [Planctomycetota bacterium]|jgi:nucleoside-diphosphate-sugar epimerase